MAAPLMVPEAVPPIRLKNGSMVTSLAPPPAAMVGEFESGNCVPLHVDDTDHVGPVQFSAPMITLTVLCAVVVPFALVAL